MKVFVFGSNLAGRHGKGSALVARRDHGARIGVGVGLTGRSYAIPTKSAKLRVLPLGQIARHVRDFIDFARHHTEMEFSIVKIGCGLAGYRPEQIARCLPGFQQTASYRSPFAAY